VARHSQGVGLSGVLRSGRAWEKLDNVAAEVGASLIVIGRHGAGAGRGAPLGSVATRLVRAANRHVLTVATDFDRLEAEAPESNRP
jgi:nucleotide-binding universal stress UspA family protein